MPSTYTLNNGIELIGTGEQSGTWGDTTNTNLELLDTALDGQVTITATSTGSDSSPNDLPISDGAASNGRNRMVIITSATDLGGDVYYQLTPNDAEKIIYVRNDLNAQDLILFQGTYSASNDYVVPNGKTAVIFFDGAGAGAVAANVFNNAHFDNLNVVGNISVGSNSELQIDHSGSAGTITNSTGNLTLDVAGDIILDADGADINFDDGGTNFGQVSKSSDSLVIKSTISDGDILLKGNDGGSEITALSLDMSAAGNATFNGNVVLDASAAAAHGDTTKQLTASGNGYYQNLQVNAYTYDFRYGVSAFNSAYSALKIGSTGDVSLNDGGFSADFRVESDNNTHMLYVDGADDRVGIGTSDPRATLEVYGSSPGLRITDSQTSFTGGTGLGSILFNNSDNSGGIEGDWYINNVAQDAFGRTDLEFRYYSNYVGDNFAFLSFDSNPFGVVFNEDSADMDFRIESDLSPYAFFLDGGNNVIGTGTSSPATYVDSGGLAIKGATASDLALVSTSISSGTNSHQIKFYNEAGSSYEIARMRVNVGAGQVNRGEFQFSVNNGGGMRPFLDVNYAGDVVFNNQTYDSDFRASTDANTHAFLVDSTTNSVSVGGNIPNSTYKLNVSSAQRIVGDTARLFVQSTNSSSGSHVSYIDVQTVAERGSHIALIDDDGVEFGIKRDYSSGSPITRAILYADDGTTQRRILDWGKAGNYAVFNEEGNDMDFRVESDNNANMFVVDAAADQVRIGQSSSTVSSSVAKLYVKDGITTDYSGELSLSYQAGNYYNYYKGMTGVNPYNDSARGLHIFNFDNDSDTGIQFWSGSSESASLYNMAKFSAGATGSSVFNDDGLVRDFRVESDTNAAMLVVDASANQVGVGTSTPNAILGVSGSAGDVLFKTPAYETIYFTGSGPSSGVTRTYDLLEFTSDNQVLEGTFEIMAYRSGFNQQRAYARYAISGYRYSGNMYTTIWQLDNNLIGFSQVEIIKTAGTPAGSLIQLQVTGSTTASGGSIKCVFHAFARSASIVYDGTYTDT